MASSGQRSRQQRRSNQRSSAPVRAAAAPQEKRAFWLPAAFAAGLFLISFVPRVQENESLTLSFWAAGLALLAFHAALYFGVPGGASSRTLLLTPPKKQHYIQAMVQLSVFLYWGWHWREVYDHAWLIFAQLLFAYAFDILLSWSRRENYVLGFGPFPIIFSINLFIWFRDDWFYLQFLMIAVGFMGKEFIRWHREGKKVHIFNPSAFTLGLFSLLLILSGTTSLTWGPEIAATLTLAPNIYFFLFATGLIVMYFFSITLVAGMAAATLFAMSAAYGGLTGVPYFIDSEIPAAVFLGLHLLVTDPSTSPRSRPGKLVFGALYGLSVFGLYAVLGAVGAPTFYDKLMAVPLLNLSVRWIDGWMNQVRSSPAWFPARMQWAPARANLAHMGLWIVLFGAMAALGRTDGRHAGDSLPFWEQACEEGRRNACQKLVQITTNYCADNSAWACNEVGRHYASGRVVDPDPDLAMGYFGRACELRFQAGCVNILEPEALAAAPPKSLDLRLLLREGGANLMNVPEPELLARACEHNWEFACDRLAGSAPSNSRAITSRGRS